MPLKEPQPWRLGRHLADTRSPLHSLPAIAPLVVLHAALVGLFQPPVAAAAAVWVQAPLIALGASPFEAALVLASSFILLGLSLSARSLRRGKERFRPLLIPWIWLEGAGWGLALHLAWNGLGGSAAVSGGLGPGDELALALGAGIYEEIVFRVALFWLVRQGLGLLARTGQPGAGGKRAGRRQPSSGPARQAGLTLLAILLTSLVFAVAHHLGGEAWSSGALLFRLVAALYLTAIYALRGLGVACCAHAAYDLAVGLG